MTACLLCIDIDVMENNIHKKETAYNMKINENVCHQFEKKTRQQHQQVLTLGMIYIFVIVSVSAFQLPSPLSGSQP